MSSDQATAGTGPLVPADPYLAEDRAARGGAGDLSLASLLDALDRADAVEGRPRPRPRRATGRRTARAGLRPVQPLRSPQAAAPAAAPAAGTAPAPTAPAPTERRGLRTALRDLTRRLALWGAGPDGVYLAWGSTARPPISLAAEPRPDAPVVLRELPSTPTVQPAASSPA